MLIDAVILLSLSFLFLPLSTCFSLSLLLSFSCCSCKFGRGWLHGREVTQLGLTIKLSWSREVGVYIFAIERHSLSLSLSLSLFPPCSTSVLYAYEQCLLCFGHCADIWYEGALYLQRASEAAVSTVHIIYPIFCVWFGVCDFLKIIPLPD